MKAQHLLENVPGLQDTAGGAMLWAVPGGIEALLHVCCRPLLEAGCWATLMFWSDIVQLLIVCKKAHRRKVVL